MGLDSGLDLYTVFRALLEAEVIPAVPNLGGRGG